MINEVISGRVLTGEEVSSINTFDEPENVIIQDFSDHEVDENTISVILPSKSVVVLTVQ
jgi:alpha-N-arabinofuranosidase